MENIKPDQMQDYNSKILNLKKLKLQTINLLKNIIFNRFILENSTKLVLMIKGDYLYGKRKSCLLLKILIVKIIKEKIQQIQKNQILFKLDLLKDLYGGQTQKVKYFLGKLKKNLMIIMKLQIQVQYKNLDQLKHYLKILNKLLQVKITQQLLLQKERYILWVMIHMVNVDQDQNKEVHLLLFMIKEQETLKKLKIYLLQLKSLQVIIIVQLYLMLGFYMVGDLINKYNFLMKKNFLKWIHLQQLYINLQDQQEIQVIMQLQIWLLVKIHHLLQLKIKVVETVKYFHVVIILTDNQVQVTQDMLVILLKWKVCQIIKQVLVKTNKRMYLLIKYLVGPNIVWHFQVLELFLNGVKTNMDNQEIKKEILQKILQFQVNLKIIMFQIQVVDGINQLLQQNQKKILLKNDIDIQKIYIYSYLYYYLIIIVQFIFYIILKIQQNINQYQLLQNQISLKINDQVIISMYIYFMVYQLSNGLKNRKIIEYHYYYLILKIC